MMPKSREFRLEQQRAAQAKNRKTKPVQLAKPAKASAGRGSLKAGRQGGAVLEVSAGRPSRKSTRRSADHTKRTTNLQLQEIRHSVAPSTQAVRAQARQARR
jgi:hypothetical protein